MFRQTLNNDNSLLYIYNYLKFVIYFNIILTSHHCKGVMKCTKYTTIILRLTIALRLKGHIDNSLSSFLCSKNINRTSWLFHCSMTAQFCEKINQHQTLGQSFFFILFIYLTVIPHPIFPKRNFVFIFLPLYLIQSHL